jgi:hypothetical protein
MKVTFNSRTDTITILFREGVAIVESDEDTPVVILDYDEQAPRCVGMCVLPLRTRALWKVIGRRPISSARSDTTRNTARRPHQSRLCTRDRW